MRELQDDELKKRGDLLENVTDVLKPCYLLLKGYNKSNEELDFKYRNLIKKLQGIDHVTWDEEVTDSGLSMHTAVSSTSSSNSNNNRQAYKRKYNNDHMDGTFILNPSKATTNVCADQINLKGGILHSYMSAIAIQIFHHGMHVLVTLLYPDE